MCTCFHSLPAHVLVDWSQKEDKHCFPDLKTLLVLKTLCCKPPRLSLRMSLWIEVTWSPTWRQTSFGAPRWPRGWASLQPLLRGRFSSVAVVGSTGWPCERWPHISGPRNTIQVEWQLSLIVVLCILEWSRVSSTSNAGPKGWSNPSEGEGSQTI